MLVVIKTRTIAEPTAPARADEDVIVHKLLEELDIAGYEIVQKPGNADFTYDTPGGDGAV